MEKLFVVTAIRVSIDNNQFQNTETHNNLDLKKLEEEFIYGGHEFGSFDKACEMNILENKIFESTIYTGVKRGTRFMYVTRIK
mgnify:CR=1 FL=1